MDRAYSTTKTLSFADAQESAELAAMKGDLGKSIDERDRFNVLSGALGGDMIRTEGCLGWIWRQWQMGTPHAEIRKVVEVFVERGLECRRIAKFYGHFAQHDLLLLHCAIFGSSDEQLRQVVETIGDSTGHFGTRPRNDGDLYAAAWSGMMKYWIMGNDVKAHEEAELIWAAFRDHLFFAAPKPLVLPWLERDWKKFKVRQEKDFEKYWNRARKDAWTVLSESDTEIVVRTGGCPIAYMWCWGHCGMALLAHRQGADVATDPLWFPAHALGRST